MVCFKGKRISSFKVISDRYASSEYAKRVLEKYLNMLLPLNAKSKSLSISIYCNDNYDDDAFALMDSDNHIAISGGKRGVIYGSYELLERYFKFQFFGHNIESYPAENINIDEICYDSKPAFKYREILGNSTGYNADSFIKLRLNSNFWFDLLKDEHGGGYKMAGIPAHSLTGEFLLKPYIKTNPEYFALVDNKRLFDAKGQMCFTNKDAVKAVTNEIIKILEKNPDANYVSISTGDNSNFCHCPSCEKAYKKESPSVIFYKTLNEIARKIGDVYPNVLVQTFSYMDLNELPKDFIFEQNIIIQYCNGNCVNHSYTDETCEINKKNLSVFKTYARVFNNILIWDYPNCFKYEMVLLPDMYYWKDKFQFYANNHVYGVFLEYNHREEDGSCVFNELKTYLFSKLLWNPFINDSEFEKLIEMFSKVYYKEAWQEVVEYLHLYESCIDRKTHYSYDLMNFETKQPVFDLIDDNKKELFFKKADAIWEQALSKSSNKSLIEKEYLSYLYLKLLTFFRKETNDPKLVNLNKRLIEGIKKYKIKLTFWGQTIDSQLKEIDKFINVSPREWNYKW